MCQFWFNVYNNKGALDNFSFIPKLFFKKAEISMPVEVYSHSYLQLQLVYKNMLSFLLAAVFKSEFFKMAATDGMTVEICTSHYISSLEVNSEAFLLHSLDRCKN